MDPIRNESYAGSEATTRDEGLRQYMLGVYNYMTAAIALTGFVAFLGSHVPALLALLYQMNPETGRVSPTILAYIVMFAPLGMVFYLSARLQHMSVQKAQTMFFLFAGIMGLSLTHIFLMYTGQSIFGALFATAGSFAALSIYGYTTKRDLTALGSFLIMGVFGIIILSIINWLFIHNSVLDLAISAALILVFAGLTAYDTQAIRRSYYEVAGNADAAMRMSIMGALRLYLDFINIFIHLLHLFGNHK